MEWNSTEKEMKKRDLRKKKREIVNFNFSTLIGPY